MKKSRDGFENFKSFGLELFNRIRDEEISEASASLSYYFILSVFPLLLFLMALLSYMPINQSEIFAYIHEIMPNTVGEFIINALKEMFNGKNSGILTFGIFTTIYSASTGIFAVMRAFNRSYNIKDDRNIITKRITSILILIIIVTIILLMVLVFVFGEYLIGWISKNVTFSTAFYTTWHILKNTLPIFFTFVSLNFVYLLSVNLKLKFKHVWMGSMFATFAILIITKLFSEYINRFSTKAVTYGSVGAIMIFVFWLFLMGYILIVGSHINAIAYNRKNKKS